MDVRMASALAGGVGNVAEFCRRQQISRQTFYKWRSRILAEGLTGLEERSRRPHRCMSAVSEAMAMLLVTTRKELHRDGCDAGASAILDALLAHDPRPLQWEIAAAEQFPSRATVHRVLVREGLIVPAPRKRPRVSSHRFSYPRPNECWQSDWTPWVLTDGTRVAIAGTLDDHSRLICGLRAGPGDADTALVWATMTDGIRRYGVPAMSLTDNGTCYSNARRGRAEVPFEVNLRALGVALVTSSIGHPQTCGKIERLWQTLKRWLRARPAPSSLAELQQLLDEFVEYYNNQRRHSAIGRRTPAAAWAAGEKARPADRPLPERVSVLSAIGDDHGNILVHPWKIGLGTRYRGRRITTVRDGGHLTFFEDTRHICHMTITNPQVRYHRAPSPRGPAPEARTRQDVSAMS